MELNVTSISNKTLFILAPLRMNKKTIIPPKIHPIKDIKLPIVRSQRLSNGLPVHFVLMGTQDVVKVEFFFWAGRPYEKEQLIARTTAALIKEGTTSLTSTFIDETFDYYGASLSTSTQTDTSSFSISCLSKQLVHVLPLFMDILVDPAFREKDLQAHISRRKHQLIEDLSKNEVIAYRQITACFFGETHPYGYNSFPDSFSVIKRKSLVDHHQRCYNAQNGFVLINGKIDTQTEGFIHKELEKIPLGKRQNARDLTVKTNVPAKILLTGQGQMQSAIRMGRRLFGRTHPDANGVYMLATILGGYFGSRLMTNIREEKGYTYSISAAYESLRFDGAFHIDTEVSPEYVEPCLQEIHLEIERLQNDLVSDKEITLVRNYLMGSFLSMVDGPFNSAETLRTLWIEQLDLPAFQSLIDSVQQMKSAKIRDLAQTYLKKEDLWTIVVGE